MTVKDLKKEIANLPDNMVVLMNDADHSFLEVGTRIETAKRLSPYVWTEDYSANAEKVLVIS